VRPLLICLVLFGACVESPPPSSTSTSLRAPAQTAVAPVPLVPLELKTQADYDALEDRWLVRRERADLVAVLQAYAAAQATPDPLLLQRIAVLLADEVGIDDDALRITLEAGTKLRDAAPQSAHTAWLNGWVLWQFLARSGFGALDASGRDVAQAIVKEWSNLLAIAPDYVGPRKHDTAEVRRDLARLQAALAEGAAARPVVATAPPRLATAAELEAIAALARFEDASANARRSMCGDWLTHDVATASAAEVRIVAACHTQLGDVSAAVAAFARLRELDGPAFDACAALGHLRERVGAERVSQALTSSNTKFACP